MRSPILVLVLCTLLATSIVSAAVNTVPRGGVVFPGEQGLDITATGVTSGSRIVWYGPGGTPATVPVTTLTVDDAANFYVSPVLFGERTGPWFIMPENTIAFYVQDPAITIRVFDLTAGFEIAGNTVWVPRGDAVGFRVDTNIADIARRPGSPGAPITIRIRGPSGIEYSAVNGYTLENIMLSGSPFETGPVWYTGTYERGSYAVWAESTANEMHTNYKREGKTVTAPVFFLMQNVNPLITTAPTTPPVTVATPVPTVTVETPAPTPTVTGTPTTPEPQETTAPPTATPTPTAPGFGFGCALLAVTAIVLECRARR
ncbi:MAG: DUF3821 domain-containing protein [Methanoregulaceae archaeon]|jgi:hypothetical protein